MEIKFGGEINSESKASVPMHKFSDFIREFFNAKTYSDDLKCIVLIIVCRPKSPQIRQRNRYTKNDKFFYLDIMLDYDTMVAADALSREIHFWDGIRQLIPYLHKLKKKISDLNSEQFRVDLENLISQYI